MTAINMDSELHIRKAVSIVPRGRRAKELLYVTVGTEIVSPLLWAIENGALKAAEAILKDLLTIRADRHHYYFAADELFRRHPDIVQRLIRTARSLLPKLLDGLVWRSRFAVEGQRRVRLGVLGLWSGLMSKEVAVARAVRVSKREPIRVLDSYHVSLTPVHSQWPLTGS